MAVIEIADLSKRLGREPDAFRLSVTSFALQEHEELAITGSSGTGKSTFLNLIAGIIAADAGRITVCGVEMTALPESERDMLRARHIGLVYQTFNLLQGFSALENVVLGSAFGGKLKGAHQRSRELLQQLGLGTKLHKRPRELSVGEQQRVAVARALVNSPDLLLADEPTANLDEHNAATVLTSLRDLARESGAALLLVTHDTRIKELLPPAIDIGSLFAVAAE